MPEIQPGSIVEHNGERRIVVDVTGDGCAVLRPENDPDGQLTAAEADTLPVVGHVESVPGWAEDAPGQWRQL